VKTVAITGWPVSQSRSPLIHGYWLKHHGLQGSYGRRPVPPDEAADFYANFFRSGLDGANVTVPHKEVAARQVDDRTPTVTRLGAANTLWVDDSHVYGFLANLDAEAPGWDRDPGLALVLGAGGAAAAVVDGLVSRGFSIRICNRSIERADLLAARYNNQAKSGLLSEANRFADAARLVVNTTSLGMKGQGAIDLDFHRFADDTIASDIVYVPLRTGFLLEAEARGLRTVGGLGMLLHQAVGGFQRWFGVKPEVTDDLRRLVEADL